MTLLLLVLVSALIVFLNVRESLEYSDPVYAPLFNGTFTVARHPPPYDMKEMAVDIHVTQGWPVWHARATYSYMAHNAGWDFVDGRPPERHAKQINWQRLGVNVACWVGMLILTAIVAQNLLSWPASTCRKIDC